ncbi:MAG: hypothetical protein RLY86_1772 [Pseudomonadota bacterium]|jgi:DNA-binding transcriptional ArsR family regulator
MNAQIAHPPAPHSATATTTAPAPVAETAPVDVATMQARAEQAADFLRSMANPHRLMLLCNLLDGELPVGELAARLEIGQTVASQHLARLRAEGLVATRREGTTIHYRIANPRAATFIQVMYGLFCAPGAGDGTGASREATETDP